MLAEKTAASALTVSKQHIRTVSHTAGKKTLASYAWGPNWPIFSFNPTEPHVTDVTVPGKTSQLQILQVKKMKDKNYEDRWFPLLSLDLMRPRPDIRGSD